MTELDEALNCLKQANEQVEAAYLLIWAALKAEHPHELEIFTGLDGTEIEWARWICHRVGSSGLTGAELIAAGRGAEVETRMMQSLHGVYI